MKKLNNKGFLLIETLSVATFMLTVLVLLFVYFKDLINVYNDNYKYNTVQGIYNAGAVKTYLEQNGNLDALKNKIDSNDPYIIIYNDSVVTHLDGYVNTSDLTTIAEQTEIKTIIYTSSNLNDLKSQQNTPGLSEDMKNFIKRLDSKDNKHRLIIEYNDNSFATIVFGYSNDKGNPGGGE